jgi:hypothetical protein
MTNRKESTLYSWIRTEELVALEDREKLAFTTYSTIANAHFDKDPVKNEGIRKEMIEKAKREMWTSTEARDKVKAAKSCNETAETYEGECCEDWLPQIEKVNAPIILANARNPEYPQYDGKPFVYCPWCGRKRP